VPKSTIRIGATLTTVFVVKITTAVFTVGQFIMGTKGIRNKVTVLFACGADYGTRRIT
jgi:hypothetical protein